LLSIPEKKTGSHGKKRDISPKAAAFIAFIPGMALVFAACLFNVFILKFFSPDGKFLPVTETRINRFTLVFLILGGFHLILFILSIRTRISTWLSSRKNLVGLLFSVNFFISMILSLEAVLGIKMVKIMLPELSDPDPVRVYRLKPEHNRMYSHVKGKPGDTGDKKKIVFMGDSVVYGFGVDADQTIPFFLNRKLEDSYEVLNAGVPGYEFSQYAYYIEELAGLDPEMIILGICLNDLSLSTTNRLTRPPDHPECKVQKRSALNRFKWTLQNRSALLNLRSILTVEKWSRDVKTDEDFIELTLNNVLKDEKRLKTQKNIALCYLRHMKEVTSERGIDFTVVVFPFRFQFEENADKEFPRYEILKETILDICNRLGIRVIEIEGFLKEKVREDSLTPEDLFIDYDHFSPGGAAIVADIIGNKIRNGR